MNEKEQEIFKKLCEIANTLNALGAITREIKTPGGTFFFVKDVMRFKDGIVNEMVNSAMENIMKDMQGFFGGTLPYSHVHMQITKDMVSPTPRQDVKIDRSKESVPKTEKLPTPSQIRALGGETAIQDFAHRYKFRVEGDAFVRV